jgi:putative spermidine/putrescine transport system substrate-binding protein
LATARSFPQLLTLLVALLTLAMPNASAAADAPVTTLRVLAWPGYADADVVRAFEQRSKVRVDLTVVASDAVMWEKMSANQGGDFDVFAVNTAELQRYIKHGLVQPVDARAIPNTRRQLPRFRDLGAIAGLVRDGKTYGIPFTYAEMGLIYDRSQFAEPPDSIAALWDPRLRGHVLAYSGASHNFSLAALALGNASPFRIGAADWPKAVERLIALRRNVLGFYTEPAEATRLFVGHHAALLFANYGSQQVQMLKAAGADIGYAIPKEGALAWLDCWTITRGAKDARLAHAWIDFMLGNEASGMLVSRQGLANTISESPGHGASDRLFWLEPTEDEARREKMWARILSGERAAKVLAP